MDVNKKSKGGRKPKMNPSKNRYVFRLTDEENIKFLNLYEASGMNSKAKFITTILFQKELKIVKVDISTIDYHTQLTKFFYQFQSIGNNYNQIVKILYRNFTEKKPYRNIHHPLNFLRRSSSILKNILQYSDLKQVAHILYERKIISFPTIDKSV